MQPVTLLMNQKNICEVVVFVGEFYPSEYFGRKDR